MGSFHGEGSHSVGLQPRLPATLLFGALGVPRHGVPRMASNRIDDVSLARRAIAVLRACVARATRTSRHRRCSIHERVRLLRGVVAARPRPDGYAEMGRLMERVHDLDDRQRKGRPGSKAYKKRQEQADDLCARVRNLAEQTRREDGAAVERHVPQRRAGGEFLLDHGMRIAKLIPDAFTEPLADPEHAKVQMIVASDPITGGKAHVLELAVLCPCGLCRECAMRVVDALEAWLEANEQHTKDVAEPLPVTKEPGSGAPKAFGRTKDGRLTDAALDVLTVLDKSPARTWAEVAERTAQDRSVGTRVEATVKKLSRMLQDRGFIRKEGEMWVRTDKPNPDRPPDAKAPAGE
jgi:hypothetical protein